ncbi:MAG: hypothetical protein ALECFALPRED_008047 [Alectoria fallacina]|uniref:Ecp2 effector protein domain-containing protein n=1 Tax=Alectoria fallacina TaxID=1903189 RepID=A0A8H3J200_9LECA|nr:MAG: hypothetical protein ALECFALPRED_008047 [Alectoria fallacina]
MHMLLHPKLLGLAFFSSSAHAMTIPQGTTLINTASTPQTNSSLNETSNSAFVCIRRGSQTAIEPLFADCAGVLRSLPLNQNVGTFYNSGAGDFQLPYFQTYRTCQVIIELRSTYDRVQSSWLAVQLAALELNGACQDVRSAPGLGIAYTYIDNLDAMKLSFRGAGRRLGDGDDGTDATESS